MFEQFLLNKIYLLPSPTQKPDLRTGNMIPFIRIMVLDLFAVMNTKVRQSLLAAATEQAMVPLDDSLFDLAAVIHILPVCFVPT
jgi:hypothetical protein